MASMNGQTVQEGTRRKPVDQTKTIHFQPLLRASVPPEELDQDEDFFSTRLPNSVRRYSVPAAPARTTVVRVTKHQGLPPTPTPRASRTTTPTPQSYQHAKHVQKRFHWLFYVGGSMVVGIALWVVGSAAFSFGQTVRDNVIYGTPRTFQMDANVGHQGTSHFIAENLHGDIVVLEIQPSNLAETHVYQGPTFEGAGTDDYVATLSFKDVTGSGKLDMIIAVNNQRFVLVNTGNAFRPTTPADKINPEVE